MIRDVDERSRLAPGLTWLGAGALALALHVGVFAAVFRQLEPVTTATGGESSVEVDLEPVEGEKAPDDMPPPETSGDPAEAAAAAANSGAAADAPATTTTPIVPRPPDLPLFPPLQPAPTTPSAPLQPEPIPSPTLPPPPSQEPPPPEPATPASPPPTSDPELLRLLPAPPPPPASPEPPPPEAVPLQPPPSVPPPRPEPRKVEALPPAEVPLPPEPLPPPRSEPPKIEPLPPAPEAPPVRASAASATTVASEEIAPAVQKLSAGREAAWRGKLVGHLNRFRRFPPGLGSGTARVGFTIDDVGQVTDIRIVSGSGNAALDDAAQALVIRASPFPRPPVGLSGKSLSFVVPIHFDMPRP